MFVNTGLVPVIHGSNDADIDRSGVPWMAGSSPRMTLPAVLHLCCI